MDASLTDRCAAAVRRLAERIRDAEQVEAAIGSLREHTRFPGSAHWRGASIAQGDAGLAFACAALDDAFPDEGWDQVGHRWLSRAVLAPEAPGHQIAYGLLTGASGLSLAVWRLSRGGLRYRKLQADVDAALLPGVESIARRLGASRRGVANGDYDAVSGVSGIVAGLLPRQDNVDVRRTLESCVDALIALAEPAEPLRWSTPPERTVDHGLLSIHPGGHLNLGLAHGVPGIIAALALAYRSGMRRDGLAEALARLTAWVVAHRMDDEWGPNWPSAVSTGPSAYAPRPCRGAWCYGAPGIAGALWLASEVLGDGKLADLAVEAVLAVHRRPAHVRNIDAPTVCHGMAGLLQVTRRLAAGTDDERLHQAGAHVAGSILDREEPDSIMGYRNLEPGGWPVDHPGLLDGSVGVLLALLDLTADTGWDRVLLLS
jgi:lantibiotic biosynthesis protein